MTHIVRPVLLLTCAILLGAALVACSPAAMRPDASPAVVIAAPPIQAPAPACALSAPCPVCPVCPPDKPTPQEAQFQEIPWRDLPGLGQATLLDSLRAFVAGCARIHTRRPWQAACAAARVPSPALESAAREFFEANFSVYRVVAPDGSDEGLVTGYYEPVLAGRREQSSEFRFPIYGAPDDLIVVDLAELHPELRHLRLRGRLQGRRLVPYYTRAEIDVPARALSARPLAWVANAVDLFFLQIQGSGQIEFASGERVRMGFADQNGHPYRSLGRTLVERGEMKLEQASMQSIKAWAANNPEKIQDALNTNPSYVFFRELPLTRSATDTAEGPPGALGVPLTPGYSVAIDPRTIPLGAPVYLSTTLSASAMPLQRLMVAQDTGGAIRGAVRADFFWGSGDEAGTQAGRMRQQGKMWLLWPKGEPLPRP